MPVTLLLVGLDNAGKTTAAKGIVGESLENVAPTVGFCPETLEYRGCEVTIFDLGGGSRIRAVWSKYFSEIHGVIFVIDSSDKGRIEECQNVLTNLLSDKKISGKPVLILANKQDVDGALDEIDVVESLRIEEIVNTYKCPARVETCSAVAIRNRKPEKAIADGFRWLIDTIVVHYDKIDRRVEADVERERRKQKEEMDRRRERLKKLREEQDRKEELARITAEPNGSAGDSDEDDVIVVHNQENIEISKEELVAEVSKEDTGAVDCQAEDGEDHSQGQATTEQTKEENRSFKMKINSTYEFIRSISMCGQNKVAMVEDPESSVHEESIDESQITSIEACELSELGLSGPQLLTESRSLSSSSSDTSVSPTLTMKEAHISTAVNNDTKSPRVIFIQSSPSQTSGQQLVEVVSSEEAKPSVNLLNDINSGLQEGRLPSSECVPIDSDDEMFSVIKVPEYENDLSSGQILSPVLSNGSITAGVKEQLELEASLNQKPKKKTFLKRLHKTAPMTTSPQSGDLMSISTTE